MKSIMESIEKTVLIENNLNLLTVCRPVNEQAEIDVAILLALLKKEANENTHKYLQTQIKLALSWDRVDIARKFIFTNDNAAKIGSLNDAMFIALTKNRVEFIKLFLENGFSIKKFVTNRMLLKMYNQV